MEQQSIQVLLIEDNPHDIYLLRDLLAESNLLAIDLIEAPSLQQALGLLTTHRIDLVLLDLSLPDSGGIETFRQVRARAAEIPIVVLTGVQDERLTQQAMQEGAQDYLVKWPEEGAAITRSIRYALERARAVREVVASERLLQAALDALPGQVAILDEQGRILATNQAWKRLVEHTPLAGGQGWEGLDLLAHCERLARGGLAAARCLATGIRAVAARQEEKVSLEYEGAGRWFQLHVTRSPEANPLRLVVTQEEITGRMRAEEENRRLLALVDSQRQRLDTMVASVPGVVWEMEGYPGAPGYRVSFVSDHVETMLGYSVQEWLEQPELWISVIHPEDQPAYIETVTRGFEEGVGWTLQFRCLSREGREVWVESRAAVVRDEWGRPVGTRGVALDITERQRMEAALRESEERYRCLVEFSPEPIVVHVQGELRYVNPAAVALIGADGAEQLLHTSVMNYIHPDSCRLVARRIQQIGEEQRPLDLVEEKLIRLDGEIVEVEVLSMPILHDGVPAVQVVLRDITARKRAAEALREANRRAIAQYGQLLERLANLAQTLGTAADLAAVYRALLDFVLVSAPCSALVVSHYDPPREAHLCVYAWIDGREEDVTQLPPLPMDDSGHSRAILTGQIVVTGEGQPERADGSPLLLGIDPPAGRPRASIAVPMMVQGRVIGGFEIQCAEAGAYSQEHAVALGMAANLAAIATENVRLLERERQQRIAAEVSEQRFRGLVQHAADLITIFDASGTILYESPSMERVLGYGPAELVGQNLFHHLHPDDMSGVEAHLQALLSSPELTVKMEFRLRHQDGRWRIFEVTGSNLLDHPAVSGLVANMRDVTERKQRERELEAIALIASALRSAQRRHEMPPIILAQLTRLLQAEAAALVILQRETLDCVIELGVGAWAPYTGVMLPQGQTRSEQVIESGQPYLTNQAAADPTILYPLPQITAVACVPLIAQEEVIGALWVGRGGDLTELDVQLLAACSDIAANALHRATLHAETEQRVQRLAALHAVDTAICSSLDLRVTLTVLLDQVISQLGVDATDVLRLNPHSKLLEYISGRGLRGRELVAAQLPLERSLAGRAALARSLVHIPDLPAAARELSHGGFNRAIEREGFACYYAVPLIAKGQVQGVLELFHRSPLQPEPEWLGFLQTLAAQAAIAIDNAMLYQDLQRSNIQLALAYDATIEGWSRALDLRDQETEGHSTRVMEMTLQLARAAGIAEAELVHLRRGALLHDIGKMGVPDRILRKPGPLNEEEWEIMRCHPSYAYELLAPIAFLRPALQIPYCHHERWDGTGYPRGLQGEQIPLAARIFAVVDVWDALCSNRPYRQGWPEARVLAYLKEQAGRQFDPRIVELFLQMRQERESQEIHPLELDSSDR